MALRPEARDVIFRGTIYTYKGAALRVRVMNIQLVDNLIIVDIEEVPTAGFDRRRLARSQILGSVGQRLSHLDVPGLA